MNNLKDNAANGKKKKIIPIGYEDLKRIIDGGFYFVDKSMMIKQLIDSAGQTSLITRPRRFGKTLNLSMIRRFFEDERTADGTKINNGYIFDDLMISGCGDEYMKHNQQYPVITLSLKSAKQPNYEMAYDSLKDEIQVEFRRHAYALQDNIPVEDKEKFYRILDGSAPAADYAKSIQVLSRCLAAYHKKNVIILIDEYDVPLENAYFEGFYDDMIKFIRSLFESALKTNPFLERSVVTGCLRISRESIFTGLNNLDVCSVMSGAFSDCFGFTESEVKKLLSYYDISAQYDELQSWYDGYLFCDTEIYNPWSILNYAKDKLLNPREFPKPYWSNTSSNSIIREMVENADSRTREELEILMDRGTIEKPVHEEITYGDIHESQDNLWNFLFFTGYLKECGRRYDGRTTFVTMKIPNVEISTVFEQSITRWFDKKVKDLDKSPLVKALEEGDCEGAADFISEQLMDTISYFDYAESFYHGFMAGILNNNGKYRVLSNRESGNGRPDILLIERKFRGRAIILEFKIADKINEMDERCAEALRQAEDERYEAGPLEEGCTQILKYGICFFRKGCMVKNAGESQTSG